MIQLNIFIKYELFLAAVIVTAAFVIVKNAAIADSPVSIRIAPLSYDLQVNGGDEKIGQIYIENLSDNNLQVAAEYSDFFIDDSGKYIFSDDRAIENPDLKRYSMKSWLSVSNENFSLEKKSSRVVGYKLSVPADAALGGHYGAIFFRTVCASPEDKNVVSTDKSSLCVSGRVGTLFLVSVGGSPDKRGEIEKINLPKFSPEDQTNLGVVIKNVGNTHFKPTGAIAVENIFGQIVSNIEIGDKTLLPTTSHLYSSEIKRQDFIGFYSLDGEIKDGNGSTMKFKKYVFMPPWREILVAIFIIMFIYWFSKKYKIKKASK